MYRAAARGKITANFELSKAHVVEKNAILQYMQYLHRCTLDDHFLKFRIISSINGILMKFDILNVTLLVNLYPFYF